MFKKIDNVELSRKVYKMLLDLLKDGEFDGIKRLPSEIELAERIGVSRSVIRDACGILEAEGFITRKRGIGTLINQEVVHTSCRLDLENNFAALIEREGYSSAVKRFPIKEGFMPDGERYYQKDKLLYANSRPAIYIQDRLMLDRPGEATGARVDDKKSMHIHIEKLSKNLAGITLLNITPKVGIESDMKILEIPSHEPYIEMVEREFDLDQNLVIHSKILFRGDMFNFTVLRKRPFEKNQKGVNQHLAEMFLS